MPKSGFAFLVALAIAQCFAPVTAGAEVYYTQDASGAIHFSNKSNPTATRYTPRELRLPKPEGLDTAAFGAALDGGEYDDLIAESGERHGVEPALIKAVMRAESGFKARAVSRKGARGLMQLMPRTARGLGVRNIYDPAQNIDGGAQHLRVLIDQFGLNLPRVLAAYNAGAARVDQYRGIPPYAETRSYVAAVLRHRRQYLKEQRMAAIGKPLRAR